MITPENYSRFCLDMLTRIRITINKACKLARKFPEKRPRLCMSIEKLTSLALEVEKLRERVEP